MANPQHLEILNQGVEAWNAWRRKNPAEKPDLIGAKFVGTDLSGCNLKSAILSNAVLVDTNLSGVDLSNAKCYNINCCTANLHGAIFSNTYLVNANLQGSNLLAAYFRTANLIGANLNSANLRSAILNAANLSAANLSRADLSNTSLIAVQALATSFNQVIFTGACLQDWSINSDTNLQNVVCDYIFLRYDDEKKEFTDRRPHDTTQVFAPGEFTKRYQIVLDTVDLFFNDGIDWKAFLNSLNDLQSEYGNDVSIQGIEKKAGGTFLVRLEVPSNTDKGLFEHQAKAFYETELQRLETKYHAELQAKDREIESYRRESANMMKIAETLASRPITVEMKVMENSSSDNYSISAHDVAGSNLIIGNSNNSPINFQQTTLPSAETINISKELEALKALLAELRSPDQRKIENAIADAQDELTKPQPNKDEVGQALDRALTYAQKTSNFAESIEKLRPHVEKSAAWLGENWYRLLALVGLTV